MTKVIVDLAGAMEKITPEMMKMFDDSLTNILMNKIAEMQAELDYLRFFYSNADFGPAHEDVVEAINTHYDKDIPEGYMFE